MEYSNLLDEKRNKPSQWICDKLTVFLTLIIISLLMLYFNQEPVKPCEPIVVQSGSVAPCEPVPPVLEYSTTTTKRPLEYKGVFESMDGVGFNFAKLKQNNTPVAKYYELDNLAPCDLSLDKPNPRVNIDQLIKGFHDCIDPLFESLEKNGAEKFNDEFPTAMMKCDNISEYQNLTIDGFKNQHEVKWALFPNCKEPNTMVTMGIGHDVDAEQSLKRTVPGTTFYGADPIIEPNLQLYSAFGKFFPFAIGKEAGVQNFKVLPNQNQKTRTYSRQDVTTVDVTYFLHNILNLKQIDYLWIDIEGGELLFLDELNRGKKLDEHGISVCQFNIEFHPDFWKEGYQVAYELLAKLRRENRFIFLKPMVTTKGVYRLFFINVEDKQCIRKFLQ